MECIISYNLHSMVRALGRMWASCLISDNSLSVTRPSGRTWTEYMINNSHSVTKA